MTPLRVISPSLRLCYGNLGMGFEIGNHTWTHDNFATPRNAARLAGELALVENELIRVKVRKPVSFAWPGHGFGPEAYAILEKAVQPSRLWH